MRYLFSNCLGVFAFDEDFNIVERTDISEADADSVSKGQWIDAEKKHAQGQSKELFFIGFKESKIEGIKITQDSVKLTKALDCFRKKEFLHPIYEKNLVRTKKRIRDSVKEDLLLMQAISNVEELDKAANIMSKRLREWYELYNPEYSRSVADHHVFVKNVIANTKEDLLKKIGLEKDKCMGADFSEEDYKPIKELAKKIESVFALRDEQVQYIENLTEKYCPNVKKEAGALIAAKLISLAGSFKKLAELPSSTVQLLGAEKALFRHMRTGAKPPKYGVIMQHPSISNAERMDKGKAARHLSQKITMAARIDYFRKNENIDIVEIKE